MDRLPADSFGSGSIVAPFTGAWIEMDQDGENDADDPVAPFTGAWIEISNRHAIWVHAASSHPSRVRGLKWNDQHRLS